MKPSFPEHFVRQDGAENRAKKLSQRLQLPVYAVYRPDEDGSWHVGTSEILERYPDRKREYCIENW